MLSAIIYDFDGVILDSVEIKTNAFHQLYLPYGDNVASKVVEHHRANGGISRFEKFSLYHRDFIGQELSARQIQDLSNRFSNMIVGDIIDSKPIKGSIEFIKKNSQNIKQFIVSGTPQEEIREIVKKLDLENHFLGVYGSPRSKSSIVQSLLLTANLIPESTIFIGDALVDYEAARDNQLRFVLIERSLNKKLFKNIQDITRVRNFTDFDLIYPDLL